MRGSGGSSVTQAIKDRINIVDVVSRYVQLRHAGGNRYMGPCPFHQETKGSFSVNAEEGFFYCFGCQAAGDIFDFYSRINGVDFKEALEFFAQEAGVQLTGSGDNKAQRTEQDRRKRALKLHDLARNHFRANLRGSSAKACRDYIAGRELDEKIVESFELGWSLDDWNALTNSFLQAGYTKEQGVDSGLLIKSDKGSIYDRFRARLMFPIKNLSGQTIAFGGRIIKKDDDAAKYINSSDSPIYKKGDNLYGLFQARRSVSAKKSIILTEGYMDVLTLHQFGYENACGVLGTALTPEQVKRLGGFASEMELIFDGDPPGRKAAMRSCEMILAKGLNCRVVLLPDPEDIDSLLRSHGKKSFEELRAQAPDGLTFCMRVLNSSYAPREVSAWVKDFLGRLEVPELSGRFIGELTRGLGIEEAAIRRELKAGLAQEGYAETSGVPAASASGTQGQDMDKQFMSFAVRCPQHLARLRDAGLEFVLSAPWASALWSKMLTCAGENFEVRLLEILDDKEKHFWIRTRTVDAPPPDEAKERMELEGICGKVEKIVSDTAYYSTKQALAPLKGDDHEIELLKTAMKKFSGKKP